MRVSLFVETTADGFLAAEDGSVDCFKAAHSQVPPGEKCGYDEFLCSIDAVVMGRKTFDVVKKFSTWWYGKKPVFVLSRDPNRIIIPALLRETGAQIAHLAGTPQEVLNKLEGSGFEHIYVDGGSEVIRQFMEAGLVDNVTVTKVPVVLGRGLQFLTKEHRSQLVVISEKKYDFGFIQTVYTVDSINSNDDSVIGTLK